MTGLTSALWHRDRIRLGGIALLATLLVTLTSNAQESTHEDRPAPDRVDDLRGALRDAFTALARKEPMFPEVRKYLEPAPAFIRDTELTLKLRSYYLNRGFSDAPDAYAWTYGGSIDYRSGWLYDTFSAGVEGFTSQRITGDNEEGTLLLAGDKNFGILGQAYGTFRYAEQYLTVYRQRLDLPYVNGRDIRMVPNTFEAYMLKGTFLEDFQYTGGYISKIKPFQENQFLSMSEQAAGTGHEGMGTAGILWAPSERFGIGGVNHFVNDTINIFYVESEYLKPVTEKFKIRFSTQMTDQRSVGDDLITGENYDTRVFGGRIAFGFEGIILRVAGQTTDSDERIRQPYGTSPGYLTLMQRNFNRAGEDAWLVGLSYDFKRIGVQGLSAFTNYAEGNSARNASTGNRIPDQREIDVTFDYRFQGRWFQGLWLRFRGSYLNLEDDRNVTDLRAILNYELPLF